MEIPPAEFSPLDVITLEAALEPFCPVAGEGGQYRPGACLPFCQICDSLLIRRKEAP